MEIDSPTDTFWKNGPGSLPEANQELLKAAGYLQSGKGGTCMSMYAQWNPDENRLPITVYALCRTTEVERTIRTVNGKFQQVVARKSVY